MSLPRIKQETLDAFRAYYYRDLEDGEQKLVDEMMSIQPELMSAVLHDSLEMKNQCEELGLDPLDMLVSHALLIGAGVIKVISNQIEANELEEEDSGREKVRCTCGAKK